MFNSLWIIYNIVDSNLLMILLWFFYLFNHKNRILFVLNCINKLSLVDNFIRYKLYIVVNLQLVSLEQLLWISYLLFMKYLQLVNFKSLDCRNLMHNYFKKQEHMMAVFIKLHFFNFSYHLWCINWLIYHRMNSMLMCLQKNHILHINHCSNYLYFLYIIITIMYNFIY